MSLTSDQTLSEATSANPTALAISVVVPIYNEEESIPHLYERLTTVLQQHGLSYEILAIDDGSRDRSFALLRELAANDQRLRVIRFRRNFGQTAAFAAGFAAAKGTVVITIDADLQNDPADIPRLLAKVDEGYDVVSGWRERRQDPFLNRRLPSQIANRLISLVTGVHLHDYGCSLKAYRAEVVKNIQLYGELHRLSQQSLRGRELKSRKWPSITPQDSTANRNMASAEPCASYSTCSLCVFCSVTRPAQCKFLVSSGCLAQRLAAAY